MQNFNLSFNKLLSPKWFSNLPAAVILCILALLPGKLFAQAPNINYGGPQVYTTGTAIGPLAPSNSGGAVAALDYGTPVSVGTGFKDAGYHHLGGLITDPTGNLFLVDEVMTETPEGYINYAYYIKVIRASDGTTVSITYDSHRLDKTLAVDAGDYLYMVDETGILKHFADGGAYDIINADITRTGGVALDGAGNLYVADIDNNLIKMIPAGSGTPVTIASVFNPLAMAVDRLGNAYVCSNNHDLYKIPAGGGNNVLVMHTDNGLWGVTVDAEGSLYVAFDTQIVRYPVGGGAPVTVVTGLTGDQKSITIDGSNNLYAVNEGNTILKFQPNGGYSISPQLPAGLKFNMTTGIISGTPTVVVPAANYTITAYNGSGKGSVAVNIKVNLASKPVISYSSPLVFMKGTAITGATPVNIGSAVAAPAYNGQVTVTPSGPGFASPLSIATDAAGNLYAGDAGSGSIDKLGAGGGGLTSLYNIPLTFGVAVDKTGNIYAADITAKTVVKVKPDGSATTIASGFSSPMGVAVDAAGNVYVADSGDGTVKKIVAGTGNVVLLASGFGNASAVAVDAAGNVYVTDRSNNLVKKITAVSGTQVTVGTGFNNPRSIAVDAVGNIFVADAGNTAVKEILAADGSTITLAAGFGNPVGIAVDGAGNIYIADSGSSSILKLIPSGGYFISPVLPNGLSFNNATGTISGTSPEVSAATDYTITAYNNSGSNSTIANIAITFPPQLTYSGPQTYLTGVAITPLVPSNGGSAINAVGYSSSSVMASNNGRNANGVVVKANGDIFVTDALLGELDHVAGNQLDRLSYNFNVPDGIGIDEAGNLFVSDSRDNLIKKISTDGSITTLPVSGLNAPGGVAVDKAGNVYVADAGNNVIKKIPAGSNTAVVIGSGFNHPHGVAVDGAGNVYVVDTGNNLVKKIPADGSAIVTIGSGFNAPLGIAVDAAGNIYIADTNNNAIKMIPAGGGTPVIIASDYSNPTAVAVDGKGNVYECKYSNSATDQIDVKKITPAEGFFITPFLPAGLNFNPVTGVINGTPTVTSPATTYTITAYNSSGSGTATVRIGVNLQAPAFSYSSPKVYNEGATITALTPPNTGGPVAEPSYNPVAAAIIPAGPPGSGFQAPLSIAVDNTGKLFVGDAGLGTINLLLPGGSPLISVFTFGTSMGIAVDGSNNLYVSDLGSKSIYKYPLGGSATLLSADFTAPMGVAVDVAGNVFVADAGDGTVKKIPVGGGAPITLGSGFSHPFAVAVDAAGNVYVTDSSNSLVKKIIPGNNTPVIIGTGFNSPKGLAVDAAGNVFVADAGNSAIKEVLASDGSTVTISTGSTGLTGVAVDGAGNVYVADANLHTVLKITPVGGYYIGPFLPAGLSFNSTTGAISGTPIVASSSTDYTVTAYNSGGVGSATLNITVKPHAPVLNYGGLHAYVINTDITALTPANTGGPVAVASYNPVAAAIIPAGPPGSGFQAPLSIAVDNTGKLFVGDAGLGTINLLLPGGSPLIPVFAFGASMGIAVDGSNNLYVSDSGSKSILKYPLGGSATLLSADFTAPMGVAVDVAGNVYVADAGDGTVKKIPVGGGGLVTLASGLGQPFAVTVDAAGNVYVTDSSNNLVKKIIPGNDTPVTIGTGFNNPRGLAVDAAGNVYVADTGNGAVKVILAADGSTITAGSGFASVLGVAVDGAGNIFAADASQHAVMKISPVGGYFISPFLLAGLSFSSATGIISGTPAIETLAVNYTVTAYNAGGGNAATVNITVKPHSPVLSYNEPQEYSAGTAIAALPPTNTGGPVAAPAYDPVAAAIIPAGPPGSGFQAPLSIAVDNTGKLFVGDAGLGTINMLLPGGSPLIPVFAFGASMGIAVDGSNNLYVSDLGSKSILKYPLGGSATLLSAGFTAPMGVAVDAAGNVYVADTGDGTVKKIPVDGGALVTLGSGFIHPFALAVDAAGNVYVTDSSNNLVKKIIPGNSTPVIIGTGFSSPKGLAVDAAGNVFVADAGNSAIKEILATDGSTVTTSTGFTGLTGVAVDGAGNVYVADANLHTVLKTTPVGGYYIGPFLPAGLSFSNSTGIISGTPEIVSAATDYTITAYNAGGSGTATVNITVSKPKSAIATLAGLATILRPVRPVFKSNVTAYTASVPYSARTTSVIARPTDTGASMQVRVNGGSYIPLTNGTASADLPLNTGTNSIEVLVTAEDGLTTKTYTITYTRAYSASLATLTYSPAIIKTKTTGSNYVDYVATVKPNVSSIAVTPVSEDPTSSITVNGRPVASGGTSAPVTLSIGTTTISTVVTAADGITTKTYSIVITRTADALLSSLTYNPLLTVAKAPGAFDFNYKATIYKAISSIAVIPVPEDPAATVTVNGQAVNAGNPSVFVPLSVGANVINTVVTASDGTTTKTYSITITREPNALLATLTYSPLSIRKVKVAGSNYVDYTATVKNAIEVVNVTPVTQDPTSTVTVNGIAVASGAASEPIPLNVGDNTINTVVTAIDGVTTNTYSIVITRQGPVSATMAYEPVKEAPLLSSAIVVHQNVSPNGDGNSDVLTIDGITAYPDNKLQIMGRSGNLVYEAKGYDNSTKVFDGHANNGRLQQAGTYFYSLEYKDGGEVKRKTGFIVLKY